EWSKCLGGYKVEFPGSIAKAIDGGFYLAGTTGSNDSIITDNHGPIGTVDAWVVKLDNLGNISWKKSYGGSATDNGYEIIPTWDGFYLICTSSSQDGDIGPHPGSVTMCLIKANSLGSIQWSRTYGNVSEFAYAAIQTSDSGIAIVGSSQTSSGIITVNHGITDFAIIKVDSLGNPEWGNAFGGSNVDKAYA